MVRGRRNLHESFHASIPADPRLSSGLQIAESSGCGRSPTRLPCVLAPLLGWLKVDSSRSNDRVAVATRALAHAAAVHKRILSLDFIRLAT